MSSRGLVTYLAVGVLVAVQATAVGHLPAPHAAASPNGIESRLLLAADLAALPAAPANLAILSVALAPGVSTRPFLVDGAMVVRVEEGVLVVGDRSVAALAAGDLLTIPAGTRARFRNEGAEAARFLLLVLMPRPAAAGQHAVVVEEGKDA